MRSITITREDVLLLKGKAYALCTGDIHALGVDMDGRYISIRHGKIIPLESDSSATIFIYEGEYSIRGKGERIGTSIWREVTRVFECMHNRPYKVMLIGGTDSGKSTLSVYIANLALARGMKVSIIDGDIGQGDLAPPACMGSSMIRGYVLDLRDLIGEEYYFIGRLSPMGIEDHMVTGLKYLTEHAKGDICIINTDGYVDGYGLTYKSEMVDTIKPDVVITFDNYDISSIRNTDTITLPSADVYKSRTDRVARRLEQYRRFLHDGKIISFLLKSKRYEFLGKRVYFRVDDAVSRDVLKGMFVALSICDSIVGFGLVSSVDGSTVNMVSNYEGEFDKVILSNVGLDDRISVEYNIQLPW